MDNYGGHTTVIYEHDTSVPGDPNTGLAIKGGDFRIKRLPPVPVLPSGQITQA